jgi:hypothetical protein
MTKIKKVIVLSQGRTGSTYVCNLIKQNFDHYVLNPFDENIENILEIINSDKKILIKDNQIIKCLHLQHNKNDIYKKYIDIINKDFYRIKLLRNNVFHLTLSRIIAEKNDVFYYTSEYNPESLKIDSSVFKHYLTNTINNFENLKNYRHFDKILYYEDLVGDSTADFDMLDLKNLLPPAPRKFLKLNYNNIIENYSELLSIYMEEKNVQL